MNDIKIFNSPEFGEVRTAKINGKDYFCGNDVANALRYTSPKNAVARHCKGALFWCPDGEQQEMKYIPEGDLYRLIIKASSQSNSEEIKKVAERFEEWIFDEVLPQLRKTGSYVLALTTEQQIQILAKGNVELRKEVTEVRNRTGKLEQRIDDFEKNLPLLPDEADQVSNSVKKRVIEILGGRESNSYHNKKISQMAFMDAYKNLKRNFNVSSYKSIKRCKLDVALKIAQEYNPPLFMKEQIEECNAQINMFGGL